MAEYLLNGRAIDWIIAAVFVEAAALLAYRAISGRGPSPAPLLSTLLAGGFLLIALRNAVSGGSATLIWLCLTAGLVAHVADLFARWDHVGPAPRVAMRATLRVRVPPVSVHPAPRAPNDESSDA